MDLAAKFSAASVVDENGQVHWEADSSGLTAFQWTTVVTFSAYTWEPDLILIEDVPYGISSQAMVKPVLRLQGMLILALVQRELLDGVVFVNPSTWQKTYPGVARGKAEDRIEAARVAALELGYTPPPLTRDYLASLDGKKPLRKHLAPLEKTMTDYIDSHLMARWAFTFEDFDQLRGQSGVQSVYI